jgi:Family of unknown function (DUF6600)
MTMKRFAMTTLLLGAFAVVLSARPAGAQVNVSVTIGGFYDQLTPYGRWIDCRYGQCWAPGGVAAGWQPYTNGEWVYTEYGWTWMSNDPWGGDPYHYGTWTFLDRYGWCWVPGTVWAPAWVTWSYGDNYVGWAPLPPTIVFGASGYSGRAVVVNPTRYVFVPMNRFVGTNVNSVRVSARQSATIFRKTRPVTRFAVSGGIVRDTAIPLATIQRAAGARIEMRSIRDARATPRSMAEGTGGKSRHVAIVAPAGEVRAAVAARSRAVSGSAGSSGEKGRKAEPKKQLRGSEPPSRQGPAGPRATVKPDRQGQRAPKTQEASPAESRGQQAARAPSQPQRKARKTPGRTEVRPSEPRREAAPIERRQGAPAGAQANPRADHAPNRAAQQASPKQGSKSKTPVKKEKVKKEKNENPR